MAFMLDQARKGTKINKWTLFLAVLLSLFFFGYGVYLTVGVLDNLLPWSKVWFMLLAVVIGFVSSIRLGKISTDRIKGIAEAVEILKKDIKNF